MEKFKASNYLHYCNDDDLLPTSSIIYATRTGVALEIPKDQAEHLQNQNWKGLPPAVLTKLIKMEAVVPAEENELDYILEYNLAHNEDTDEVMLSYIIQPSANCQLGCHYCGQEHVKENLSQNTADLIYDRIKGKVEENEDSLKFLNITWYGAEPLMGLGSLVSLSNRLMDLAKKHELEYSASMITNGLSLKPKLYEKLVHEHKLTSFQITIDGTAEFHDRRRMLKNETASFDIILRNVENIVKSEFYQNSDSIIKIRSNVDGDNQKNIFELIALLDKRGILSEVAFYVSPIHDWGDNEASQINGISKEDFAQYEIDVFLELINYGVNIPSSLLPTRNSKPCMVVSSTSEVFDTYGNVSTCWEVPYTPYYENTDFVSGNMHKVDNISTEDAPMRHWFKEIPTNESWCKSCKFLPVCGGACPKNWYQDTPACPSFKFNINERLIMKKMSSIN